VASTARDPRTSNLRLAVDPGPIDDLDRRLVDRLQADGRESNRSLARALDINEATVAARLRRLERDQMVRVVALTDMRAFGYGHLALVLIRVADRPLLDVAPELAAIPSTISVSVTSGRFDIVATVLARSRSELADVVGEAIPQVRGVAAVRAEFGLDVLRFDSDWAALRATAGAVPPTLQPQDADELDLGIIHALQRDARRSNRAIAAELGVSEGTIRARLRRLESERYIRIQAIKDVETFGLGANAFVGIHVAGGEVDAVGRALLDLPGVAVVVRSLGEFDFVAVVMAGSREGLLALLLDRLDRVAGVRSTETFENYATLKHVYTWARVF
jgi:DNA-binding Lrp family transcriptional regulator